MLLLLGLPRLARLLVLVLPVVHDPDHRRAGHRCDFHQIEAPLLGDGARLFDWDDPHLLARHIDQPDRTDPDLVVHAGLALLDNRSPFSCSSGSGQQKKMEQAGGHPPDRTSQSAGSCYPLDPAAPHTEVQAERWAASIKPPLPSLCAKTRANPPGCQRPSARYASVLERSSATTCLTNSETGITTCFCSAPRCRTATVPASASRLPTTAR